MKLLKFIPVILALSLIMTSCANDTKKKDTESTTTKTEIKTQNNAANLNNTITTSPNTITPANSPKMQQVTPAGMNPPHGQPGHDCKVAVGAPLNSSPSATGSPINTGVQQNPIQTGPRVNTPGPRINQATPAGMNPPHGQPGHDCKVAVGAPLNSGTTK